MAAGRDCCMGPLASAPRSAMVACPLRKACTRRRPRAKERRSTVAWPAFEPNYWPTTNVISGTVGYRVARVRSGNGWTMPRMAARYRDPSREGRASSRYARHGQQLGGESPLGNEVVRTPSRRQRRHREMGSEGSPRQSPDPRDTNRIRGWIARMSRPNTVKSETTKGLSGKCGGAGRKAAVLIRGDLPECRGDPTGSAARCWWTRQGSAEAVVPAGMDHAGKGRTSDRGATWTDSWMGHRPQPPCPRGRPASGGGR